MDILTILSRFKGQRSCVRYLEQIRWKDGISCPYCGATSISKIKRSLRHHCNSCNRSFSVTVGTLFEDSNLPLRKWFVAIGLITNAKKGISSRQLARDLGVHRNTAWYLQFRIRKAMEGPEDRLLQGLVEIDEVYIGGDLGNKTKRHRQAVKQSGKIMGGMEHKKPIVGLLQRMGEVRVQVLEKAHGKTLKPLIKSMVDQTATIITDGFGGYSGLKLCFADHQIINHQADEWVRDGYHTNTLEGFWSLLKRSIYGQYHQVSHLYLQHYANECAFKYSNRNSKHLFEYLIELMIKKKKNTAEP